MEVNGLQLTSKYKVKNRVHGYRCMYRCNTPTTMQAAPNLASCLPRAPPARTPQHAHPRPPHQVARRNCKHVVAKASNLPPDAGSLPSEQQDQATALPPQPTSNNGGNHSTNAIPRLQDLLSKRPRWPSVDDARLPLWLRLLLHSSQLVRTHLVPLLMLHCLMDTIVFILHRFSHRATNALAVALLPAITQGTHTLQQPSCCCHSFLHRVTRQPVVAIKQSRGCHVGNRIPSTRGLCVFSNIPSRACAAQHGACHHGRPCQHRRAG